MKYEILFRGKSINSNEWVESMTVAKGTIKRKRDCIYLETDENVWLGIIPETLGLYSTICDKKGVKIYEGDLFKLGVGKDVFEVRFEHGCFLAFLCNKQYGIIGELQICFIDVIGNIYDNPELIQKSSYCDICKQQLTAEEIKVGHCFNCGEQDI